MVEKNQGKNDRVKFRLTSNLMLIWVLIPFKPMFFFHYFLEIAPPLWPNKGVMVLCFFHFISNFIIFKWKVVSIYLKNLNLYKKDNTFCSRVLTQFLFFKLLTSLVPMVVPTKHQTFNVNSLKPNLELGLELA